jgi:hypothetical protein
VRATATSSSGARSFSSVVYSSSSRLRFLRSTVVRDTGTAAPTARESLSRDTHGMAAVKLVAGAARCAAQKSNSASVADAPRVRAAGSGQRSSPLGSPPNCCSVSVSVAIRPQPALQARGADGGEQFLGKGPSVCNIQGLNVGWVYRPGPITSGHLHSTTRTRLHARGRTRVHTH